MGPPKPLVEALWQLTAAIQNATPFITERSQQVTHTPAIVALYFPSIVCAVQVRVHECLHSVSINLVEGHAGVEPLEFRSLITELKRGTFPQSSNWVPLPEEYLEPVLGGSRTPSTAPTGASSVSSARTGVSSLTAGNSGESARTPVARVDNPIPDTEFGSITVRPGGTSTVNLRLQNYATAPERMALTIDLQADLHAILPDRDCDGAGPARLRAGHSRWVRGS